MRLDGFVEVVGRLRSLLEVVGEVERGILEELSSLPVRKGCSIDFRWVKNSVGQKYWYYYLVCYERGRRRHYYIGGFPEKAFERARAAERARQLARVLRDLRKARSRAAVRIAKAGRHLEEALRILEEAMESAKDEVGGGRREVVADA